MLPPITPLVWWRDNTPYTGDRKVEGKDQLQSLMERLAAKNKVDLSNRTWNNCAREDGRPAKMAAT
jgi:hypothetical protein